MEQALLVADCTEDEFGRAVALGGDTAVVASPGEYLANSDVCNGTVRIYVHRDDTWCLQTKLFVSQNQTSSYSFFGSTVAIDGNTVLVAADSLNTANSSTSVYVFTRAGDSWSMQQLTLPLPLQAPIYYQSVALAGDTAVAATGGKVYIFRRDSMGGTWSYQALLKSPKKDNCFGDRVAIADNTIIVSGKDKGCASAYIFVRSARGDWLEQAQLTTHQSNGSSNTVAISGNTAIIGTPKRKFTARRSLCFRAPLIYRSMVRAG